MTAADTSMSDAPIGARRALTPKEAAGIRQEVGRLERVESKSRPTLARHRASDARPVLASSTRRLPPCSSLDTRNRRTRSTASPRSATCARATNAHVMRAHAMNALAPSAHHVRLRRADKASRHARPWLARALRCAPFPSRAHERSRRRWAWRSPEARRTIVAGMRAARSAEYAFGRIVSSCCWRCR